ncbi:AAA family ATPase [Bradyrhizobium sp. LCT2]|uniref:AAA family ATPase n=1 Tax=Bradyrhizobium sp. LCT2 TaxID=2493093 RepID=UPI001373E093|nr:AAA family ATPase [Bradyrhizobium sp. LCT2]QHP70992.1 AAA family ATPase [Bradyrhizobium sp. LCT2]
MVDPINFDEVKKQFFAKMKQKAEEVKEPCVLRAADVQPREHDWLWDGHLLCAAVEMMTGLPSIGKSQVHCSFVACVTTTKPWPDGTDSGEPANVVMLTAEDALDQELIPRLMAAGADLKRVHILKCIKSDGNDRQFLLDSDLDMLEKVVTEIGDVKLITIDPITSYQGVKIDSHKTTAVRSQLGPLKDFAERNHVAVSCITHPAKAAGNKAIDWFIGSQAYIAAARVGHVCIPEMETDDNGDKIETGRVLFCHVKHNASERMPTLAFRKKSFDLHGTSCDPFTIIQSVRVEWGEDSVDISADEAIREAASSGNVNRLTGKQAEVVAFLRQMLQGGEPVAKRDIDAEAAKRGYSHEQLKTARNNLKKGGDDIVAAQVPGQAHAGWTWQWLRF